MTPLPPHTWLRANLPPKLAGAPGDTFIAILDAPESLQRLAFELGIRCERERAASSVERTLRSCAQRSDADELLEPTRFASETDVDTADTDKPPPDSAA